MISNGEFYHGEYVLGVEQEMTASPVCARIYLKERVCENLTCPWGMIKSSRNKIIQKETALTLTTTGDKSSFTEDMSVTHRYN